MKISDLILYKEYRLSEIAEAFDNGSFIYGGGMIYTVKHNTLVLISKHTPDAIYQDEPQGDKYIYTGMGQVGDQTITLGNKRLVNAKRDNTMYIFSSRMLLINLNIMDECRLTMLITMI